MKCIRTHNLKHAMMNVANDHKIAPLSGIPLLPYLTQVSNIILIALHSFHSMNL